MKINYSIVENESILDRLIEIAQNIETLNKKYISELDSIQSVYSSHSSQEFSKTILDDILSYLEKYNAFCQALNVFASVHQIHTETQMYINDVINKMLR